MPSYAIVGSGWGGTLWAHAVRASVDHTVLDRVGTPPWGADVVVVATPPATHAAVALDLAATGVAVLVESPVATTLEDADRLVAAVDAGARVAATSHLLHAPLVRAFLARARDLGALRHVGMRAASVDRGADGPAHPDGAGVLTTVGPGAVAVLLATLGGDRPVAVRARVERRHDDGRPAAVTAAITTDSGTHVTFDVDDAAASAVWDVQVASGSSALRLELQPDPHLEQLGVDLPTPARRYAIEPAQLETFGYLDQVAEAGADLLAGRPPWLGVTFGRAVLEVLCAAAASTTVDSPVQLPWSGPRDRSVADLLAGDA